MLFRSSKQKKFIVYNIKNISAYNFINGNNNVLIANIEDSSYENNVKYQVKNNWLKLGLKNENIVNIDNSDKSKFDNFKHNVFFYKNKFIDFLIKRIEKNTIPNLSQHIIYKDAATPSTLYRYTLNYKGAAYGWATFPSQLFSSELKQATSIAGLFLTGHWTTQTQGIPGVAYLGSDTAKLILKREKIL